jgi:glutaredoxin
MYLVFAKRGCKYSINGKNLLKSRGKKYKSILCKDKDDLIAKLKKHKLKSTVLTFPRIYEDGKLIGGYDELVKHL